MHCLNKNIYEIAKYILGYLSLINLAFHTHLLIIKIITLRKPLSD